MRSKPIRTDLLEQILSDEFRRRFWEKVKISESDQCWIWKASREQFGYGQMVIRFAGRQFHFSAHKLAWIIHNNGDVPIGKSVLHSCEGVPECCNPSHLRPGTQLDNVRDMDRQGRRVNKQPLGEKSGMAKITEADVVEIRRMYSKPGHSIPEIMSKFGISSTNVWLIGTHKAWKHVT